MIWKVKLFEKTCPWILHHHLIHQKWTLPSPFICATNTHNLVRVVLIRAKYLFVLPVTKETKHFQKKKKFIQWLHKTRPSASFRKKNSAQLEGDLWTTPKGHPIPHVHSEKSKQNTPLHHKCSSPRAEPLFAWLWLVADANLLWAKSTADWLVAGSWCWFGVRENHCLLIGWQAKRTAVWTYILCGHK